MVRHSRNGENKQRVGNARLCKPSLVHGEHRVSSEDFYNLVETKFASHLRGGDVDPDRALKQARHIACASSGIDERRFARPLESLATPLSPQTQADLFRTVGLDMSVRAIEGALEHAGNLHPSEISAIVYVSHSPFPFPPLTCHLGEALPFPRDCVHVPVTSMGCAGGGFALGAALDLARADPTQNVLILSVELCSLGFRPHRRGMSWFLNATIFGDAVAAAVVRGGAVPPSASFGRGDDEQQDSEDSLELLQRWQRHVPGTTDVSFFEYDEAGYHFVTTQALCDVVRTSVPPFVTELAHSVFGKAPRDLALNVIHPGGARMVRECVAELDLGGTASEKGAYGSLRRGGNLASATVLDILAESWPSIRDGDELVVVGMGPGFVIAGAALRRRDNQANSEKPTRARAANRHGGVVAETRNGSAHRVRTLQGNARWGGIVAVLFAAMLQYGILQGKAFLASPVPLSRESPKSENSRPRHPLRTWP